MQLLSCVVFLLIPILIHAECCGLSRVVFKISDPKNYTCSDFGAKWYTSTTFRFELFIDSTSDICEINICGDGTTPNTFIKHCGLGYCRWGTCGCGSCIEGDPVETLISMHGSKIQDVHIS